MLGKLDEKDIEKLEGSLHKVNVGLSVNPLGGIICSDAVEEQVSIMDNEELQRMLGQSESRQVFHDKVSAYCKKQLEILGSKRGASIG